MPDLSSSLFRAPHTVVMGIVNVTPDSFSDGGRYLDHAAAIAHAFDLLAQGADILDVGGESTRPGSEAVSAEEELRRVLPVIEGILARQPACVVSIDTMKPAVADACLQRGARIVNDISGLRSAEMRAVIAQHGGAAVAMHMQGTPRTMQHNPTYGDVVLEVREELAKCLQIARESGIADVAVDPGIGFGKTAAHNFQLLRQLEAFHELGAPILVGPSRKAFIGSLSPGSKPHERVEGTIAACVISAMNGAHAVRVHDVAACKRALLVVDAVRSISQ